MLLQIPGILIKKYFNYEILGTCHKLTMAWSMNLTKDIKEITH